MRKILATSLFAMLFLSAFAMVPSVAANGGYPTGVYPLYAGQTNLVGTITVANDETNLYVEYELNEEAIAYGWLLCEVHLDIGVPTTGDPTGIPLVKGNPPPGQFEYFAYPEDTSYTFTIPLSEVTGTDIAIAAHAKLCHCYEVQTGTQNVTVDELTVSATTGTPVESDLLAAGTYRVTASGTYFFRNEFAPDGYLADAEWAERYDAYGTGWVRGDATPYSAPFGGLDIVLAEGIPYTPISWLSAVDGSTAFNPAHVYYFDITLAADDLLSFKIYDNAYGDNSGSLSLAITTEVPVMETVCEYETAWAAQGAPLTNDFSGKNWATFVTYHVSSWQFVGHVDVPAYAAAVSPPLVTTAYALDSGELYKVVATGVASASGTSAYKIEFDAEYSFNHGDGGTTPGDSATDPWVDGVTGYGSYGSNLLDLKVNGEFVDWGPYTNTHVYDYEFTADGTPLTLELQIYDIYSWNNYGSIHVDLFVWA